jgi:hypothetical protein
MIGIGLDRDANHAGMADLEDTDLAIRKLPRRLDGVEDVLQLAFLVQHHACAQFLIRCRDGDQEFQRTRQRGPVRRGDAERTSHHHHGRLQRQHPSVGQAGRLEGKPEQIGVIGLPADFHGRTDEGAVDQVGKCRARVAGQAKVAQDTVELHHGGFLLATLGRADVAPHAVAKTLQKGGLRRGEFLWRRRQSRLAKHLCADQQLCAHARVSGSAQGDEHLLDTTVFRRNHRRTPGLSAVQGFDQRVDLLDAAPRPRLQQRRDPVILADDHRNDELTRLDACQGKIADLGLDPGSLLRVSGEHDDPGLGRLQTGIDAGDDVVAGRDLPLVEPWLDATPVQCNRQRLDSRLVLGRMADENAQMPLSTADDRLALQRLPDHTGRRQLWLCIPDLLARTEETTGNRGSTRWHRQLDVVIFAHCCRCTTSLPGNLRHIAHAILRFLGIE